MLKKKKAGAGTGTGKVGKTPQKSRGRANVDAGVRVAWRAEEDALALRLRDEGKTWQQVADAVSKLGTPRGSAACMQRLLYIAAKREKGTLALRPQSDGRIEVDVQIAGQVLHVTTARTLEQILAYLSAAA